MTTACGGGGSGSSAPSSSPAAAPAATAAGEPVKVTLTEFKVSLADQTLPAGTYTFVIDNSGQTAHALEVKGPDGLDEKTATLRGGQSANLTVTLRQGAYELWCPVGNHKDQGMDTTITVDAAATSTPTGGGSY
ncbi:cupredoxin domain-containing protein [Amycolatopsis saalfeldensis]|uniref:cupredoxin domain-containing protein n=1 Tax=Amycolatopsis saalfeldensis TaxID=394193 RepID=UPI001C433888|nr:cupredoxin domain-containing protein [Amycolatopsis saalfeldensis]